MYKPKIAIIDSGVSLNAVTSQIQGVALSFGNGLYNEKDFMLEKTENT